MTEKIFETVGKNNIKNVNEKLNDSFDRDEKTSIWILALLHTIGDFGCNFLDLTYW